MTTEVVFAQQAVQQLAALHAWIVDASGFPDRADDFIDAIIEHCEALAEFPLRGTARDDLRPGLRTIGFRRRVIIAFAVNENITQVLGIYYGGQDYESRLTRPD